MTFPTTSPAPVRLLADLRWACSGCGECCRRFALGPVEPELIRKLSALGIQSPGPDTTSRTWYTTRRSPSGDLDFFLSHRGEACVFLQDDALCALHARHGENTKPAFCREFPFTFVEDDEGPIGTVRPHCACFYETFRQAPHPRAEAEAAWGLSRLVPVRRFQPELVAILPGMGVPYAVFRQIEPVLLEEAALASPDETPEATVARLRRFLYELVGRPAPAPRRDALDQGFERMISSLASFLPADPSPEEPPLPADALVFLNLMLRQGILGRQFSTAGGLPEALGRFLFDSRLLRRISARDPSGALTGESVARALTAWSRRQDYPDAHLGLSRQLPALVALFLNAEAS